MILKGLVLVTIFFAARMDVQCFILCEMPNCTHVEHSPVCGTNQITYNNSCLLERQSTENICLKGDFNPIVKVYDGPCKKHDSTTSGSVIT
ncbi:hypothetical protein MAR_010000 [Mya arenaria]|uniref:Kazal-like domain-containing protein n=1 Tax=Mya arenaria TaxID=6604 RepID=A0ABY7E0B0_MYAAR|nr:serine protease inhibitor dipetalogastin-like [Mya arenaria]XP_052802883.1 serine protease inhibitor dipetalogastin-like [Mya arenaria]WAR03392.1 hypothetical protein MAR_009950 [Mya arenaria]WAR03442.1 hypothetical protein MAR_010000 [Mya arenaria]